MNYIAYNEISVYNKYGDYMKKIGIIAAMQEEKNAILDLMNDRETKMINNIEFSIGKIGQSDCVVTESGVGKVNSARVTQLLIDKFDINAIINVGSAGAISNKLNIGDIIIGDKLVQHDFDITAFGHKKGYISNVGEYVESDKEMIKKVKSIINRVDGDINIQIGTIATGDVFCNTVKLKEFIANEFGAIAVEMEGAAIAQVAYLNEIPFIVIRSISDSPNGKNEIDFETYLELASKRCAKIIKAYCE